MLKAAAVSGDVAALEAALAQGSCTPEALNADKLPGWWDGVTALIGAAGTFIY